jgi:hypothetical protein
MSGLRIRIEDLKRGKGLRGVCWRDLLLPAVVTIRQNDYREMRAPAELIREAAFAGGIKVLLTRLKGTHHDQVIQL